MTKLPPRISRERLTMIKMTELYCRENHKPASPGLCPQCQSLLDYAMTRLDRCPYQENKPTCAKCTIHCYQPAMRVKVRQLMRYAGPRMLLHHPVLAVRHLLDGLRKPPANPRRRKTT